MAVPRPTCNKFLRHPLVDRLGIRRRSLARHAARYAATRAAAQPSGRGGVVAASRDLAVGTARRLAMKHGQCDRLGCDGVQCPALSRIRPFVPRGLLMPIGGVRASTIDGGQATRTRAGQARRKSRSTRTKLCPAEDVKARPSAGPRDEPGIVRQPPRCGAEPRDPLLHRYQGLPRHLVRRSTGRSPPCSAGRGIGARHA